MNFDRPPPPAHPTPQSGSGQAGSDCARPGKTWLRVAEGPGQRLRVSGGLNLRVPGLLPKSRRAQATPLASGRSAGLPVQTNAVCFDGVSRTGYTESVGEAWHSMCPMCRKRLPHDCSRSEGRWRLVERCKIDAADAHGPWPRAMSAARQLGHPTERHRQLQLQKVEPSCPPASAPGGAAGTRNLNWEWHFRVTSDSVTVSGMRGVPLCVRSASAESKST